MSVHGTCVSRFEPVREELGRNFAERGEIGASVCVIVEGEVVVDLWGGVADRASGRPWGPSTIGVVWSCTKGAVALCAHVLASRGQLDLEAPVASYWPEFGKHGKRAITVRAVLEHQAALPAIRTPLREGGLYDWDYMVGVLADEEPWWPPGTRQAYHATTFGHLVGEVVRRVDGRDVGTFFPDEVAGPLGLDFHLGLREEDEGRVAPTIRMDLPKGGEEVWRFLEVANRDPDSIQGLTVRNTGRHTGDQDSRAAHAAVLPSQGGITNARGLARMYEAVLNGWLVDERRLTALTAGRPAEDDATLLVRARFGQGFLLSSDNRRGPAGARDSMILGRSAFGHPGAGGSVGFADPEEQLAFGYTMNKQGRGVLLNARGQALIDAVYRALGKRTDEPGFWG